MDFIGAVSEEVPERNGQRLVAHTALGASEGLVATIEGPRVLIFPNQEGRLTCVASVPAWRAGWKSSSKDADVASIIDDIFWRLSQFMLRSRWLEAMTALALAYGRAVDFRSDWAGYSPFVPTPVRLREHVERLEGGARPLAPGLKPPSGGLSTRERIAAAWLARMDLSDPATHRCAYYLWRAHELRSRHDIEGALGSLASFISVANAFALDIRGPTDETRGERVARCLGMTEADARALNYVYEVRSRVAAHPAPSLWWDIGEIYEEEIEPMFGLCTRVFNGLVSLARMRHPAFTSWSEWLVANGQEMLATVDFDQLVPMPESEPLPLP